jgi:hypothetical protein
VNQQEFQVDSQQVSLPLCQQASPAFLQLVNLQHDQQVCPVVSHQHNRQESQADNPQHCQ